VDAWSVYWNLLLLSLCSSYFLDEASPLQSCSVKKHFTQDICTLKSFYFLAREQILILSIYNHGNLQHPDLAIHAIPTAQQPTAKDPCM
jgi:hypothetical protein